jgi:hypothetical protein
MDALNNNAPDENSNDQDGSEGGVYLNRRYHQLAGSSSDPVSASEEGYGPSGVPDIRWTNGATGESFTLPGEMCLRDDFILLAMTLDVPQRCIAIMSYVDNDDLPTSTTELKYLIRDFAGPFLPGCLFSNDRRQTQCDICDDIIPIDDLSEANSYSIICCNDRQLCCKYCCKACKNEEGYCWMCYSGRTSESTQFALDMRPYIPSTPRHILLEQCWGSQSQPSTYEGSLPNGEEREDESWQMWKEIFPFGPKLPFLYNLPFLYKKALLNTVNLYALDTIRPD